MYAGYTRSYIVEVIRFQWNYKSSLDMLNRIIWVDVFTLLQWSERSDLPGRHTRNRVSGRRAEVHLCEQDRAKHVPFGHGRQDLGERR